MRIFLRKSIAKIISKETKQTLKGFEYKNKKKIINILPQISEEKLRKFLINDLRINKGDNLFIHASLDMINTTLTPLEVLRILLNIVGENGSISVPTFIRYSSKEWMLMKKEFNIKRTPSGMGIFSERVRRHKDASRSLHPTKSVATIGKISQDILNEHHLDKYQFGKKSPFYKLLEHDVKVIGLGAPMSYLSMVHVIEDVYPDTYPLSVNEKNIFSKNSIDKDNTSVVVKTLVHDLKVIIKANPEKFIKRYMDKKDYVISKHYLSPFFMVKGNALFKELESQMSAGNTIYD